MDNYIDVSRGYWAKSVDWVKSKGWIKSIGVPNRFSKDDILIEFESLHKQLSIIERGIDIQSEHYVEAVVLVKLFSIEDTIKKIDKNFPLVLPRMDRDIILSMRDLFIERIVDLRLVLVTSGYSCCRAASPY